MMLSLKAKQIIMACKETYPIAKVLFHLVDDYNP
jgi:hypothetical protein